MALLLFDRFFYFISCISNSSCKYNAADTAENRGHIPPPFITAKNNKGATWAPLLFFAAAMLAGLTQAFLERRQLARMQACIGAIAFQQGCMATRLHQLTALHHNDAVGTFDGRQAVGDDDG